MGAIHVHSTHSDGTGRPDEIARAAQEAGLDFLVITDHNNAGARQTFGERRVGGLVVLVGAELTPLKNHYLALGFSGACPPHQLGPADAIRRVRAKGGFGFVAHPADPGNAFLRLMDFSWPDRSDLGFEGIEIWNLQSAWSESTRNLRQAVTTFLHPERAVGAPAGEVLAWWDHLGRTRPVAALAGVDAHAVKVRRVFGLVRFTAFPYARVFRMLQTGVQVEGDGPGDFPTERRRILDALRTGRAFMVRRTLGAASGFRFVYRGSRRAEMGDEIPAGPGVFRVHAPAPGEIRLLRNGVPVARGDAPDLTCPSVGPGVYRVEVWRRARDVSVPWIYSNAIYLRPGDGVEPGHDR